MAGQSRDNSLDHVVVVVFENRSLDNVLGRLYGPGDGKTFDGVAGKGLTNPIPEWSGPSTAPTTARQPGVAARTSAARWTRGIISSQCSRRG